MGVLGRLRSGVGDGGRFGQFAGGVGMVPGEAGAAAAADADDHVGDSVGHGGLRRAVN